MPGVTIQNQPRQILTCQLFQVLASKTSPDKMEDTFLLNNYNLSDRKIFQKFLNILEFFCTVNISSINHSINMYFVAYGCCHMVQWFLKSTVLVKWGSFENGSNPIHIHWIRTGSQPYWKFMYSIVLQTIFHEY